MADKNMARSKPLANRGDDPLGANSEIARKLKQYYSSLVTEEVPDRFAQLLSKLDSVESGRDKS